MTVSRRRGLLAGTVLSLACAAGVPLATVGASSARAAASDNARLPSGQFITPTATPGSVFANLNPGLASHPNYLAGQGMTAVVSPDKKTLVVLTSGFNTIQTATGALDATASSEYIFFYDISAGAPKQKQVLQIPTAYAGIAFSPDGTKLYVGSGGGDSIYTYADTNGIWAQSGTPLALGVTGVGNEQGPSTAGLAVSPDGTRLLVANIYSDSVSLVDLTTGTLVGSYDLRPGVENAARSGVAGGETPFWVTAVGNDLAYVTSQRDREVVALTLENGAPKVVARIPIEGTPVESIANADGSRLYVAADNDDSVQVIDTATNKVVQRIAVAAPFNLLTAAPRYRGAAPNALALSADSKFLYVSNGGENAVAVVSLAGTPTTVALLPTGWYPNSVAVANGWFYAVNGKSDPGPNPGNCQGSLADEPSPPPYVSLCQPNQYILQLEAGGLTAAPIPTNPLTLGALTLQVANNDNLLSPETARDISVMAALHKRIKHVIYIIKENRTYDQLLGDLGRGNGDPTLVEFGQAITPNFHAIATDFVDLDNFEDPAEVSGNGWEWSTAGREPDFNVKTIPLDYSARPTNAPYNSEGQVRDVDVGQPTVAARQTADPTYPNDPNLLPGTGSDDEADAPDDDGPTGTRGTGYLWNDALTSGITVRNYGYFEDLDRYGATPSNYGAKDTQIPEDETPYADRVVQGYPVNNALIPLTDPYFRGFDNAYPDYYRVQEWKREFTADESAGTVPNLTLLRLMHDHMGNFTTALNGIDTPELQQADDDYAVGLVAQIVSQSKDAGDTLIFVVEDDAQDGPDHVDAHRSTAYVIGPYVKQGAVISQRYTTINMLATIEDVLGMQHLNLNDATQAPMTKVFDLRQSTWRYVATPSSYLYGTTLPLPARSADAGPIPTSTHDATWWANATKGYDWSHEDRIPAVAFNEVVWHGLFGDRPYPTTRSGRDLTPVRRVAAHPGDAVVLK